MALGAVCVFEALFVFTDANGLCCAGFESHLDFTEQADFFATDDFDRAVDRVVAGQLDVRADHPFAFVVRECDVWFCDCVHFRDLVGSCVARGDRRKVA